MNHTGARRPLRPGRALTLRMLNDAAAARRGYDPRKTADENAGRDEVFARPDEDLDWPQVPASPVPAKTLRALARKGRGADTAVAHVAPGEIVIPRALQSPEVLNALRRAAAVRNVPLGQLTVGDAANSINPSTGAPEFGLLSGFGEWVSGLFGARPAAAADDVADLAPSVPSINNAMGDTTQARVTLDPVDETAMQAALGKTFDANNKKFQEQANERARITGALYDPRVAAGLDLINQTEGGSVDKWTGGTRFNNLDDHPGFVPPGHRMAGQSAAGLYQMQKGTFNDMKDKIGPLDFHEPDQKLATAAYLDRLGALKPLRSGDLDGFLEKASVSAGWASLPFSETDDWGYTGFEVRPVPGKSRVDMNTGKVEFAPNFRITKQAKPYADVQRIYNENLKRYLGR